jgi:carboxypeptidase C (cathepsin A)
MFLSLSILCVLSFGFVVNSITAYTTDALNDQVIDLPGLSYDIAFNQFSGYINLPDTKKQIHYWFVEAENDPESAPLVFWTNGGPGCSGLIGFLTEQGPFRPDAKGNVNPNPYAWNTVANMVFIEQPVGVGFSYSDNDDDYKIGDDQAAKDNLATIRGFISRFPHLKSVPLYITSESYGGHYMPTLAVEIINFNDGLSSDNGSDHINFHGFAVGNPYTDYYSGVGAEMETYWGKQLLPKPSWDVYVANGCLSTSGQLNNSVCSSLILDFMKKIGNLNPYALDYPVCISSQQRVMRSFIFGDSVVPTYEPCEDEFSTNYLNMPEVKKSLHVKDNIVWEECSRTTRYQMMDKMLPMERYYNTILDSKTHPNLRILVYSGDDDSVCGTIGTQRWIYDLGYPVAKKFNWNVWTVDGQTAGYITKFDTPYSKDSRFAFMTVHFAGHEVPTYKPKEALELFKMYLDNNI